MEYIRFFKGLQEAEIRYLVCGGLAVNIYGIPRMTHDIDILIDFEEDNMKRFEVFAQQMDYASTIPLRLSLLADKAKRYEMIQTKNLIAYSFSNNQAGHMSVDVLMDVPIDFDLMWEQRTIRRIDENTSIYLVSIEHLIDLKRYANRHHDRQDISLLSKFVK